MMLLGLCLALSSSLAADRQATDSPTNPLLFLAGEQFTLSWQHSIEKTRWEEWYRVSTDDNGKPVLHLDRARIKGSAAGMEPPDDAQLINAWYEYRPTTPLPAKLRLTRSSYAADYELCVQDRCQPMETWLNHTAPPRNLILLWGCGQDERVAK